MSQCEGTTLKGDRCKREARPGSRWCSIHEDQAPESARRREPMEWDTDTILKTAVGVALVGAILFFRLRR